MRVALQQAVAQRGVHVALRVLGTRTLLGATAGCPGTPGVALASHATTAIGYGKDGRPINRSDISRVLALKAAITRGYSG